LLEFKISFAKWVDHHFAFCFARRRLALSLD
jgi:hypothetical protein